MEKGRRRRGEPGERSVQNHFLLKRERTWHTEMGEMGAVVGVAVAVAVTVADVEVSSKCVTATNDPHVFGLPLGDERVSTAKEEKRERKRVSGSGSQRRLCSQN